MSKSILNELKRLNNESFHIDVKVVESTRTNNFLIIFNGYYVYDSALLYEDALKVKEEVHFLMKRFPIREHPTKEVFSKWTKKTNKYCKVFADSELMLVNPETGEIQSTIKGNKKSILFW